MSRFKEENREYAANLVLWMRTEAEGGAVLDPCAPRWPADLVQSQKDLLVLVHGFNNHQRDAQDAYLAFRTRQKGLMPSSQGERLEAMLGDAFWPGDANWQGALDLVDFFVYPKTIPSARQTAGVLAAYLRTRTEVLNLYFIGHSMGCRVILETIRLLRSDASFTTPIRKVCLMAAAVPTFKVLPDEELDVAFRAADQVCVLYSPDDEVLTFAFPPGQTLAGDGEGFFPSAIGHRGDIPVSPGHIERHRVSRANHSDYWGANANRSSDIAAERVRDFLGLASQAPSIPETSVPENEIAERTDSPSRSDPPARAVGGP